MLMVKADEKNGIFRGHMSILQQYDRAYNLPEVWGLSWMRAEPFGATVRWHRLRARLQEGASQP